MSFWTIFSAVCAKPHINIHLLNPHIETALLLVGFITVMYKRGSFYNPYTTAFLFSSLSSASCLLWHHTSAMAMVVRSHHRLRICSNVTPLPDGSYRSCSDTGIWVPEGSDQRIIRAAVAAISPTKLGRSKWLPDDPWRAGVIFCCPSSPQTLTSLYPS